MATQTMPSVNRAGGSTSIADVVDRILDKGLVVDAWVRVSLVGLEILTVEARAVVASVDTYLKYAERIGELGLASTPQKPLEALAQHELPSVEEIKEYLQSGGKFSLDAMSKQFGLPREAVAELVHRLDSAVSAEDEGEEKDEKHDKDEQLSEGHP